MWHFIAAAYWVFVAAGAKKDLDAAVDWIYRQVCTCHSDIEELGRILGGNARSASILGSCSEEANNKKI